LHGGIVDGNILATLFVVELKLGGVVAAVVLLLDLVIIAVVLTMAGLPALVLGQGCAMGHSYRGGHVRGELLVIAKARSMTQAQERVCMKRCN